MSATRLFAILLIVFGILGLAYGSFSYTKTDQVAKIGPIEINAEKTHTINIPVWAGIAGILVGGMLFVYGKKE